MSNFLSSVSHETRTPLNAISTTLDLAMRDETLVNDIKEKYIKLPYINAQLQTYFINDLVDYVETNSQNKIALTLEVIDIEDIIKHVMEL